MSSSATRALRILGMIGGAGRPIGVAEIARASSLAPGTVFRSLDALVRANFIERYQSSSRFVPGPAAERLRWSLIARFRMREAVLPYLRQLASISGETASLHVRLGWYGVRIASAPGTAEVTNAPPLGETRLLGTYYAGRAILAFLGEADIAQYRIWSAAHSDPLVEKERKLQVVKEIGFSLGDTELPETSAIAFPIRQDGKAIAAIAIEGPVFLRAGADTGMLSGWREIIAHVESLARTQAVLFENPFSHLDPEFFAL